MLQIKKKFEHILFALAFTIPTLLVYLWTEPVLSGAGDLNIAEFLMSEKKIGPGFYYISPILCKILQPLNRVWHINWWSFFSVFMYFCALFIILWFTNKQLQGVDWTIRLLVSCLFVLFFWELILKEEINFAITASCTAVSGFLISLDAVSDWAKKRKCIAKLCVGFIFFMCAELTRGTINLIFVPFSLMAALYIMVFPLPHEGGFYRLITEAKKKVYWSIPCVLLLTAVAVGSTAGKVYSNSHSDYKLWRDTNKAAGDVCDYRECYPEYVENPEIYERVGIRESWLNMIYDFCYSDKNTFNPDSLGIMRAFKGGVRTSLSDFVTDLKGRSLLWISMLGFVAILLWLYGKERMFIPLVGSMTGFILCSYWCIFLRGRVAWRVTSCYTLFALLAFMIMAMNTSQAQRGKITLEKRLNFLAGLCLISLIAVIAVCDEKQFSRPQVGLTNENQAKILEYIDAHDDTLYLYHDLIRFVGAYDVWAGHAPDYLDNYIPITTCFAYGCREELERRGIMDLYGDMLTKPKIFVEFTSYDVFDIFLRYLCDYYDACTTVTIAENLSGNLYLRFSSRVFPHGERVVDSINSVTLEDMFGESSGVEEAYLIECRMEPEVISAYDDYWVNVLDHSSGLEYSYGMTWEEKKVLGTILCMENTWNPEDCEMSLLGMDEQGIIYRLEDITPLFSETVKNEQESE